MTNEKTIVKVTNVKTLMSSWTTGEDYKTVSKTPMFLEVEDTRKRQIKCDLDSHFEGKVLSFDYEIISVNRPTERVEVLIEKIKSQLDLDILKMKNPKKVTVSDTEKGTCGLYSYIGNEALYHLLGGKTNGLTAMIKRVNNDTHWYLRDKDGKYLDVTKDFFTEDPIDYSSGRGTGFLSKRPSKRTQVLLNKIDTLNTL